MSDPSKQDHLKANPPQMWAAYLSMRNEAVQLIRVAQSKLILAEGYQQQIPAEALHKQEMGQYRFALNIVANHLKSGTEDTLESLLKYYKKNGIEFTLKETKKRAGQ